MAEIPAVERLQINDHIAVHMQNDEPPYVIHGRYYGENDEYIVVCGTVGDLIAVNVYVRKVHVLYIERLK